MDATPPRGRPSWRLHIFRVALILVFFGSIGFILINWPMQLAPTAILIMVAAASAAVFAAYFVPNDLSDRFKRALMVGASAAGLIAALVAVPAIQDGRSPRQTTLSATSETPSQPTAAGTTKTSPVTPSPSPDPLTATLRVGYECEIFTLPTSQLRALSKVSHHDAKWVYGHGGASANSDMSLTIQGKGKDAVVLLGLRVVALERNPVPTNVATVGCDAYGGEQTSRYFDVILGNPPRVASRPGFDEPLDRKKREPAAKFPYRVSNSDPEYFDLSVSGPVCFCTWRLALDWTSRGRAGTLIVDRGFDKIVSDTSSIEDDSRPEYAFYQNKWHPPLPK